MSETIGTAYIKIAPSTEGLSGSISNALSGESASAGKTSGQSIGSSLVSTLKGVIAAAGIGEIVKTALDAGGALQQSFGGLDTLYEDASSAAKEYAQQAYTAGISANDYAEQAVSFGASLKSAFGNDVTKAAEAANTAIMDMADNSAKMGTDIESIQTAYQGFAKQNYTMLDNLKLGYGGTKSEMERLLDEANKINAENGKVTKYSIDNLGDVYEAIHVVQEDLGLTGVAADEAKTTFTGSMGAMQAAATNLMANLTTGADISDNLYELTDTFVTFFNMNLLPMIGNLIKGLPSVLDGLISGAIREINIIATNAPELVSMGLDLITQLSTSLISNIPYLIEAAYNLIAALIDAMITTDWESVVNDFITSLKDNLDIAAGEILGTDGDIIGSVIGKRLNFGRLAL